MEKWVVILFFMSWTLGLYSQSLVSQQVGANVGLYNSNIFYEHNYGR